MKNQSNKSVKAGSLKYQTSGGVSIQRQAKILSYQNAMHEVLQRINVCKGAIFASGYEDPGRYSRWDIGFVNPPVELIAKGREFTFRSLNKRGVQLIKMFKVMLKNHDHLASLYHEGLELKGVVKEMPEFFFEEERSKQPTIFSILRTVINNMYSKKDSYLGFYVDLGYDLVFQFTPIDFQHQRTGNDLHLFLPDELYVIDHKLESAYRFRYEFSCYGVTTIGHKRIGAEFPLQTGVSSEVVSDHTDGEYVKRVQSVIDGTKQGDFFEVVLSQEFQTGFTGTPRDLFELIRQRNPSPYEFIINLGTEQLVGASPEMFVRVDGQQIETCPISGTIKRGRNAIEDAEQILQLLNSRKDRAELDMCTDVDRNDKSLVCKPGTVQIIGRRMIEKYSKLFHTVDHVVGILRDDCDGIDGLLAQMWAVTLTGAPKLAAMQMIENSEKSSRNWYGGCVGMLYFNGNINTGITIRTVFLQSGTAKIRVGSTLLYDSIPVEEEQETRLKAEAFIKAVVGMSGNTLVEVSPVSVLSEAKIVLFVTNNDSFVHTLANYVRQTGSIVQTVASNLALQVLEKMKPDLVFISPGPGRPKDFGVPNLVNYCVERSIPVFGVCLGLQGMIEAFDGALSVLKQPVHGKASQIICNQSGIFSGFPETFTAGRYHSLYAIRVPECFEVTAKDENGIVMAIQHRNLPLAAMQFHPESLLTLENNIGLKLISQVISKLTES